MGFMNSEWTRTATSGYMLSISVPAGKPRQWRLRLRDAGNDVPPAEVFYPDQLPGCSISQLAAVPQTKPRP
jgi:hypothetical protein